MCFIVKLFACTLANPIVPNDFSISRTGTNNLERTTKDLLPVLDISPLSSEVSGI